MPVDVDTELLGRARVALNGNRPESGQRVISASDLLAKRFEPPRWAVEDMLAEGLSLRVGPPKLGKSWLVLGVAVAVASGGLALNRINVEPGDVLYGALEDNERRLAERLRMILGDRPAPSRLHLATAWPRLGEGAEAALDAWLSDHPEARLVIVDTLARLRPLVSGAGSLYGLDYAAVAGLKAVADRHRVALVAVHHTRKMAAVDPLDTVSGTHGLAGAADAVLVMRREPGRADASLYLRGRDVPERDHALVFDADGCRWELVGEVAEFRRSEERAELLQLLRDAGEALTPKQIAEALGRKDGAVRVMLHRMAGAGEVVARDGRYAPTHSRSNGNSGNAVTPTPARSGATVTPLLLLQGIEAGNDAPIGSGVYVCNRCGLPRSRDGRSCPSCGATEGTER